MLLRKGVVPYEYMDSWERFVEKLLPKKENFYSSLNIEDITDVDYSHVKRVFKIFSNKNIVEYHNLFVQSGYYFQMFLSILWINVLKYMTLTLLIFEACLKKTGIKSEILTNADILLMVEKGVRGGICHAIHRYAKANKYMKKPY